MRSGLSRLCTTGFCILARVRTNESGLDHSLGNIPADARPNPGEQCNVAPYRPRDRAGDAIRLRFDNTFGAPVTFGVGRAASISQQSGEHFARTSHAGNVRW